MKIEDLLPISSALPMSGVDKVSLHLPASRLLGRLYLPCWRFEAMVLVVRGDSRKLAMVKG
jgi:hypothetical protein